MPASGRLILATWSGYLPSGSATEYLVPATCRSPTSIRHWPPSASPCHRRPKVHGPRSTAQTPRPKTPAQRPGLSRLRPEKVDGSHFGFSTNSEKIPQTLGRDRGTPFSSSGEEQTTRKHGPAFMKLFFENFSEKISRE